MNGGQSNEVGWTNKIRETSAREGGLEGWRFGGAQVLSNYVQVTKSGEK
jgi:hypothetical protein